MPLDRRRSLVRRLTYCVEFRVNTSLPVNGADHLAPPVSADPPDRAAEVAFNDLTHLAAQICGTPVALLRLSDDQHAWLKAYHGPQSSVAQAYAIACTYSDSEHDPVVVRDLASDTRLIAELPTNGTPALCFYAAVPLLADDGQPLGTLAVLDHQPRDLSAAQHEALHMLGRQAVAQLTLRRQQQAWFEHELDQAILTAVERAITVVDQQGRIVRLNQVCEQLMGYPLDEVRGRPIWDVFMTSAEAAQAVAEFAQIEPSTLPSTTERIWTTRDGSIQRISWTNSAVLDASGTIRYIISISASLPERRGRTATQQREQTFLSAMLDNLEDGIMACDADGVITLFNRATREFHGLPPEAIPAAQWSQHFDLFMPDGRTPIPMEQIPLYRALHGEQVHNVEIVIAPRNGPPRWLLASGQAIVDARGTKLGAVITMHNITERKQAQQAQQASEERLRMLIGNAPLVLYSFDRNGIFTLSDGKGLEKLGLRAGEVVGKSLFDLYRDFPEIVEDTRRALRGEQFHATRQVGPIAFQTWYEPLRDPNGELNGAVGISIDVTERQQAADERARLQEEIIRMQQLALAELSTPLIPLNDQIVVMPLVGSLDSHRVQQVLDTLLSGIEASRAEVAIIDITGVSVVDTQVANTLLQAAQAVKLLGARVVLTGIRPEVAQTLVGLGVDLRAIVTRSTLQDGISYASKQR